MTNSTVRRGPTLKLEKHASFLRAERPYRDMWKEKPAGQLPMILEEQVLDSLSVVGNAACMHKGGKRLDARKKSGALG